MSTKNTNRSVKSSFVSRFIEMCGTDDARTISEYHGISYQAAKNYLAGRIPEASVLVKLSEKSPVSIHWLLTGEGDKYVDKRGKTEAELVVSLISELIEPATIVKILAAISEDRVRAAIEKQDIVPAKPKEETVTLSRDKILEERRAEVEEADALLEDKEKS